MRCIVFNCTNSQNIRNRTVTFHRFPRILDMRNKWISALKVDPNIVTNWSVVCSEHFCDNDFIGKTKDSKRLYPRAVPHVVADNEIDFVVIPRCSYVEAAARENKNLCSNAENTEMVENIQNVAPKILNEPVTNFNVLVPNVKKITSKRALESSDDLSITMPREKVGKEKLSVLGKLDKEKYKKIKTQNQKVRQSSKRNASLNEIISKIKSNNLINEETSEILENLGAMNADLFEKKFKDLSNSTKYQPALRSFALNLNFLSPKAYEYVQENFETCLPHSRTISKWYKCYDYCPGFTKESFDAISDVVEKAKERSEKIILNLICDEIAVRRHIDCSNNVPIGYTFIGEGDCSSTEAVKILVFMVVCINQSWKIPIGYFPVTLFDANQKANLIKHCIENILATGAEVIGLTFDGAAVNFTAAKLLGSDLQDISTESIFKLDDSLDNKFCILPDPCHMIKLIRMFFEEIGEFRDCENKIIKWQYLNMLIELQENSRLNLGNQLGKAYLYFKDKNMKVILVEQALSRSVADALDFCWEVLRLPEFKGSEGTVKFIRQINDIFDILSSKTIYKFGFRKALCQDNIDNFISFGNNFISYLSQLRTLDGQLIITHKRKTGFIGIIACLLNMKTIYERFIVSKMLSFVPFYKLNKEHIELFYSSIRSHLVGNYNPSVKQFKFAYKKFIIRCRIREGGIGNCIPLENIKILNLSSSTPIKSKYIKYMNSYNSVVVNVVNYENNLFLDKHNYFSDVSLLTENTNHIVKYIAGFVVFKLQSILECNNCKIDLEGVIEQQSLVSFKSKGFLKIPSKSVETVCLIAEKELRLQTKLLDKNTSILDKLFFNRILLNTQHSIIGANVFEGHIKSSDHYNIVVKTLLDIFLKTRYFYITKRINKKP